MLATVTLTIESADEFIALGNALSILAGKSPAGSTTIVTEAPAAKKEIAKPRKAKAQPEPQPEPEPEVEEDDDLGLGDEEPEVEEVTKAMVAKELRAFIAKVGDTGPKKALEVLKKFGATKFDELKEESYGKFLSALGQAA